MRIKCLMNGDIKQEMQCTIHKLLPPRLLTSMNLFSAKHDTYA